MEPPCVYLRFVCERETFNLFSVGSSPCCRPRARKRSLCNLFLNAIFTARKQPVEIIIRSSSGFPQTIDHDGDGGSGTRIELMSVDGDKQLIRFFNLEEATGKLTLNLRQEGIEQMNGVYQLVFRVSVCFRAVLVGVFYVNRRRPLE